MFTFKKTLTAVICTLLVLCFCIPGFAANDWVTVYVSSSGSDSNNGLSESAPVATLNKAYSLSGTNKNIVVMSNLSFNVPSAAYAGKIKIVGKAGTEVLTLPGYVFLTGALEFDNLKLATSAQIYANGYPFTIGENITSDALMIYGGSSTNAVASTHLTLLGGTYSEIYAGGFKQDVTGNTNLVFGGNANKGYSISDADSNFCQTYIYGGSTNAYVKGSTNITIKDNAVAGYVFGAGYITSDTGITGDVTETHINIEGGKVAGVYGGSNNTELTNCNTNITVTGGLIESVYGGSNGKQLTGSTNLTFLGGDVSRRVYGGCYNDASRSGLSLKYSTDYYVTGSTTITIGSGAKVASKTSLHSDNQTNVGIYSGSRTKSSHSGEVNTLIFNDNCYSSFSSKIGSTEYIFFQFKSHHNHIVKAGTGGAVLGTKNAKTVYIKPDKNNYGAIDTNYYIDENASLSASTTNVTFNKNFALTAVTPTVSGTSVTAKVGYIAKNVKNRLSPKIYTAVYDKNTGRMLDCRISDAVASQTEITFSDMDGSAGTSDYTVTAMLIDGDGKPIVESISA